MNETELAWRLALAAGAGGLVGLERELRNKRAGLRTNMLVSVGAAIYVCLSIMLTTEQGDVTRIIAQVVTGMGFLGAGVIMQQGLTVYGLTTAATLWCSAALGCLAAAASVTMTVIATVFIVGINLLSFLDDWLEKNRNKHGKTSHMVHSEKTPPS